MAKKAKAKAPKKAAKSQASDDAGNAKACAVLSYLLIGLIWYLVDEKMKKDSFVKFHVKQGLVLWICILVIEVIGRILWVFGGLGYLINFILTLLVLVLVIIGIINAASDKQNELPVIGSFAKMFTF